jgi:hypothetical protein
MSYVLGNKSKAQLVGVEPRLVAAVVLAISSCESDFSVFDGIRGARQQAYMVQKGVSKSTNSYHLYGLAVDLVPYFSGRNWWDSTDPSTQKRINKAFKDIHNAMKAASRIVGISIDNGFDLWGWDNPHWQLTGLRQVYDIRNIKHEL